MPSYTKTILCLANSIKHYPLRCIAGREVTQNGIHGWVRPVSPIAGQEGAIPPQSSLMTNGQQIAPLDFVTISFTGHQPHGCQTENHLIDGQPWVKVSVLTRANITPYIQDVPDLWNFGNSTYNGVNDKISPQEFAVFGDSLRLILAADFTYAVNMEGYQAYPQKRKLRGTFTYKGIKYTLKITDPVLCANIAAMEIGKIYAQPNAVLCVSITDIYAPANAHFKLIAAVF
ncbi:hypothetical protein H8K47_15350 [Undibacterium sp. CY7W]|uniref:Dual OB-containing domain-containing protein n=1 Tax=Undibacterium rugosum TaxID=2762291 RepID=A0A923I2T2_9BURK|nr:hypothetical protein [Undibacterium rugosum]MBC3936743.1 hypothetical protein [Undibacterium rugosum]